MPASSVAAVAIRIGLPSASPCQDHDHPAFHQSVGKRRNYDGEHRHLGLAALSKLSHGERDGIDIGHAGKRRDRVEPACVAWSPARS